MRSHRLLPNPDPDMPGRPFESDSLQWLANIVRMSRLFTSARRDYLVTQPQQSNWLNWASDWTDLARRAWLYEAKIEPIRAMFRQSGYCYPPVFELRGTTISSAVRKSQDDPIEVTWSLSNSAKNLDGVVTALCSGDEVLAARIAALVTDQPEECCATPNPKSKRPNEYFFAFALQALFKGASDEAVALLGKVKSTPNTFTEFGIQARMLRAIARPDPDGFVRGLDDLLEWFEPWALHRSRRLKSESFGSWSAAAWSVLACRTNILDVDDLPDSSPYFPLDLVRVAVAFDTQSNPFEFREFAVEEFGYSLAEMTDEWLMSARLSRDGSIVDPPYSAR